MTEGVSAQGESSQDPRFRQGMVHLQVGDWEEAIQCFEELAEQYPDSGPVQHALGEARFKAKLDASTRIRPKLWIIPWRPILIRSLILAATVFLAIQGVRLVQRQVAPALEELQEQQRLAALEAEANDFFEGGAWDEAEARYHELLTATPEHPEVEVRLAQIEEEREIAALYEKGVAFHDAGQDEDALSLFTTLQIYRPRYLDSSLRIQEILQERDQDALFAQAETAYEAGQALEALALYEQIRSQYINYRREIIEERLYNLYMQLGRGLIEQDPPAPEAIPQALDYFTLALALQPRSTEAASEQHLVSLYLDGQARYAASQWEGAIAQLRTVFDQRPGYLRGTAAGMLYEAYIRTGDGFRDAVEPDCGLAYQRYGLAAALPVPDTAVAVARQHAVAFCVPPTNTPTVTPTPTATPTATSPPTITPIPPTRAPTATATPWNLAMLHNQIIYRSDTEDQEGLWVMEPSGKNRRYLGLFEAYSGQYYALREAERFSPDGTRRVFVKRASRGVAIFMYQPPHPQYGPLPDKQLSFLEDLSYDPVWSPDGSRVAFVSNTNGSDDIWVVDANGEGQRWLVNNDWEWDKQPSWSPDSQRIVFWSNRYGLKKVFVMDANGNNVRRLTESDVLDEYDPIWIK